MDVAFLTADFSNLTRVDADLTQCLPGHGAAFGYRWGRTVDLACLGWRPTAQHLCHYYASRLLQGAGDPGGRGHQARRGDQPEGHAHQGVLRVSWSPPANLVGATSVTYHERVGRTAWKPTTSTSVTVKGKKGVTLAVQVRAVNEAGVGPVVRVSGVPK